MKILRKRPILGLAPILGVALIIGLLPGVAPAGEGKDVPVPPPGQVATLQIPAEYTPSEATAAAVAVAHVRTTAAHNLDAHMALIDPNIKFRSDPARQFGHGAQLYCGRYGFVRRVPSFVRLDQLYVVGGPLGSVVLVQRADINQAAGAGNLGGYAVLVSSLLRVNNDGLVNEWYDAPINRIGPLTTAEGGQASLPTDTTIPAECEPYPKGGTTTPPAPETGFLTYQTSSPERWYNQEQTGAATAVRGWFAGWNASDSALLGSYVRGDVIYRADPDADLVKGRASLLTAISGLMGKRTLTELYVVGSDWQTSVLTESVEGNRRIASYFRVQNGMIVEWMDMVVQKKGKPA